MLELTPASAAGYLLDRGAIGPSEQVHIRELSGGVSNTVLLVRRPEVPGGDFVLKQALPRLKVQQEWLCSIERIWREVETLEICGQLLANEERGLSNFCIRPLWTTSVPQVLFSDRTNYCYAMTAAPSGHQTWKEQLLSGQADPAIAAACGTLLGKLHASSWRNSGIAERLEDRSFFDSLRLDPYYRRLATVHPDLAAILNKLIDDTHDSRLSLVHGDYSPKNLLISPGQIWLIDFEVGHFGDPAFDLGFFLTHLALKAIHNSDRREEYFSLIDKFWTDYRGALLCIFDAKEVIDLSRRSALHWAACMLARVDGKSPVDYLTPPEQLVVRRIAKDLLLQPVATTAEVLNKLRDLGQST